jgi:hypothetical protein
MGLLSTKMLVVKVILVFTLFAVVVAGPAHAASEADIRNLRMATEQLNSSLPAIQSDGTRVEKVKVGPGYVWTFTRTHLENVYSDELKDRIQRNEMSAVKEQFCSQFAAFNVLKKGLITRFVFLDKNGKLIAATEVGMGHCRR